jgi:hypothetical protein
MQANSHFKPFNFAMVVALVDRGCACRGCTVAAIVPGTGTGA